ncbi:MAG: hypothetical protein ACOH1T_04570 [Microbacteriaceae bacterium]
MANATARMTQSLVKNVRRPGVVSALFAGIGVLAFLAVQQVLFTLVNFVSLAAYPSQQDSSGLFELEQPDMGVVYWQSAASNVMFTALPMAFGVFVSLWIIAPIADSLVLRFVVARSVLAGAIGGLMVFLVGLLAWFVVAVSQTGSLFGNSFPWPVSSPAGLLAPVIDAVTTSLSVFASTLPVALLAGVLLWMWLRGRDKPHNVSGILDEV